MRAKLFSQMRKVQNLFSTKATRIIRVLLVNPYIGWTIKDLAKEANVSLGYTHAVIMSMIDQGHIYRDNSYSLKLSDPMILLQRWAAYHSYISMNKFLRYHTFEKNIEVFISNMKEVNDPQYALSVLTGAHLVDPYVRPTTIHFYINQQDNAKRWVELLNLRPVETGGNVSIVLPYDEGVFYGMSEVGGVNVVSKIQLYVDLLNYPARGAEAAEIVLETLKKLWKY